MPDRHAAENYADQELDRILDKALANYADAEPDPSLRARVMARTEELPARRTWRIAWLAAAACAAALLLAFLLYPAKRTPDDRAVNAPVIAAAPSIASAPEPQVPMSTTSAESVHPHAALAKHGAHRRAQPVPVRFSSFPSPSPLTVKENMLLKFAAKHPDQARHFLVVTAEDRAPLETKPLSIVPIHIAALTSPKPLELEK